MSELSRGTVRVVSGAEPASARIEVFDGADWVKIRALSVAIEITPSGTIAKIQVVRPLIECEIAADRLMIDLVERGEVAPALHRRAGSLPG